MRRLIGPVVVLALTVAVQGRYTAAEQARGTGVAAAHPYLTAISFANGNNGWVAGHTARQGFIYHTRDGGRSWTRRTVPFIATQLQFVNSRIGWAMGFGPVRCGVPNPCQWQIVRTRDGGNTWSRGLNAGRCWALSPLDFITNREGWAVESNAPCTTAARGVTTRVIASTNGGGSWHVVFTPSLRIISVHFGTRRDGWVTTDAVTSSNPVCHTVLYHTADAGRSWRPQFHLDGYCAGKVDFIDGRHGWLLLTNTASCSESACFDLRLYRTYDGGKQWRLGDGTRPRSGPAWFGPSGFPVAPIFVTRRAGYMAVSAGAGIGRGGVDVTRDGGHEWRREQPFGLQVSDLSPVTAQNVWAIGCTQHTNQCSHVLHSSDGGASWLRIDPSNCTATRRHNRTSCRVREVDTAAGMGQPKELARWFVPFHLSSLP